MVKILFLASNPDKTSPLQLDEEIRSITNKIRASDYRDTLELVSLWAVRPDDLLQALNEHKPQIVHFSGHGSTAGDIVLMDDNHQVKPVSAIALKMLFSTLKDNIQVVVLNACYSQMQAQAITETIDCAVGMSTAVGDEAAITFAASFYRAIGFGRSIKEAFDQGKTALLLEGIPESDTPQLLTRSGIDPSLVFPMSKKPQGESSVIKAFERMKRVLSRLNQDVNGTFFVDEQPIPKQLNEYYIHYAAIARFINQYPDDIDGAYEEIWAHGGQGRVHITKTQAFEAVVSGFFAAYEEAK